MGRDDFAAALDALAYLGGEAALDPADVATVERLVRVRRRTDPLGPVTSCWDVLVGDPQHDVRPATYSLAATVIDILEHEDEQRSVWSMSVRRLMAGLR